MQFCGDHWAALRTAVEARGLSALIAEDGERAVSNLASELTGGRTIDNFDPLMAAHNGIAANAMRMIAEKYVQSPMLLMVDDPAHPERACPICCLNWIHRDHDEHCTKPGCDYPAGETYEWMIDRAADDSRDEWVRLGGGG